jgi:hypothetical protein
MKIIEENTLLATIRTVKTQQRLSIYAIYDYKILADWFDVQGSDRKTIVDIFGLEYEISYAHVIVDQSIVNYFNFVYQIKKIKEFLFDDSKIKYILDFSDNQHSKNIFFEKRDHPILTFCGLHCQRSDLFE